MRIAPNVITPSPLIKTFLTLSLFITFCNWTLWHMISVAMGRMCCYGCRLWNSINKKLAITCKSVSLAPLKSLHPIKYSCIYLLLAFHHEIRKCPFSKQYTWTWGCEQSISGRILMHSCKAVINILGWHWDYCGAYLLQQLCQWICWWHPIP